MTKEEVLHDFQDINYMYNDCGMNDMLSKDLDDYARQIREELLKEVYSIWVDWNSGKIDEEYFDSVILNMIKEQNE